MEKIFGEYFACGTDGESIILKGTNIFNAEATNKWQIIIENDMDILGEYPQGIPGSKEYAGRNFALDVYKITIDSGDLYFGFVEVRMCWYLFYKFSEEDILKLQAKSIH